MKNKPYIEKMFICEKSRLKNLNQEIYKRFIKPIYIPLLTFFWFFTHVVEGIIIQGYVNKNSSKDS